MNRKQLDAALAATIALIVHSAEIRAQTPTDSVRKLDSLWAQSYARNDTTLAQQLMAEDIVITSSNGIIKTRDDEMKDIRATPGGTIHYFRTSDVRVRVYGDAAVSSGLAEWSFTFKDRTFNSKRRYTATFVRGGPLGRRMVALHIGPAREPDPPPVTKESR